MRGGWADGHFVRLVGVFRNVTLPNGVLDDCGEACLGHSLRQLLLGNTDRGVRVDPVLFADAVVDIKAGVIDASRKLTVARRWFGLKAAICI